MGKRKSITGIRKKRPKQPSPRAANEDLHHGHDVPSDCTSETAVPMSGQLPAEQSVQWQAVCVKKKRQMAKLAPEKVLPGNLELRMQNIPQSTIKSRWKVLDEATQVRVAEIYRSVELPVLATEQSDAHKINAQAAFSLVTQSMCKRLPKMPFPPKTKAYQFDYTGLIRENRELQHRLSTLAESCASLTKQSETQKSDLDAEKRGVEKLEATSTRQPRYLLPLDEDSFPNDMPNDIGLILYDTMG